MCYSCFKSSRKASSQGRATMPIGAGYDATQAGAETAGASAYAHDVFISYRHVPPDREWVRGKLVPALDAAGISVCVDYRSFRLGAPLVIEMGRAVEQSRYTLAVLTPNYLAGTFAELENVLAEHLGLERHEQRLLLVMLRDCQPRLGLRARLWLDMREPGDFTPAVARLIGELRPLPPP
jgi:TIR domain